MSAIGLTNMHLGLPDLGFMDLSQVAEHVMAIRGGTDLPLITDADSGFGNAINVTHTLEQAGASAIQLEDQHTPKRCGHFAGKGRRPDAQRDTKQWRLVADPVRAGLAADSR